MVRNSTRLPPAACWQTASWRLSPTNTASPSTPPPDTAATVHCRVGSLALDVGRLDDRPPLLDFGLVKGGEPVRRLLLARGDVETELGEARAHRRIGEDLHHRAVELCDDLLR